MKKFFWQSFVILALSLVIGLAYNQFSKAPLPLFETYDAHKVDLILNNKTGSEAPGETKIPEFDEIDAETLQSLVEAETAVLLDARPPEDFQQGYIPCATSLPISNFKETYDTVSHLLSEDKIIICYCEGFNCTDSSMLAMELYKEGFKDIFVYKGGIEEWQQLGFPMQTPQDREVN
jgi:rhodanese-related sulfurtransferase